MITITITSTIINTTITITSTITIAEHTLRRPAGVAGGSEPNTDAAGEAASEPEAQEPVPESTEVSM